MVPGEVDLMDVSARYLDNIDLIAEVHLVCKVSLFTKIRLLDMDQLLVN